MRKELIKLYRIYFFTYKKVYIVKAYERGEMTLQEVNATMQSYFGLIKHCTNEGLRENIINGFVLHCTDAARAKARESR